MWHQQHLDLLNVKLAAFNAAQHVGLLIKCFWGTFVFASHLCQHIFVPTSPRVSSCRFSCRFRLSAAETPSSFQAGSPIFSAHTHGKIIGLFDDESTQLQLPQTIAQSSPLPQCSFATKYPRSGIVSSPAYQRPTSPHMHPTFNHVLL